MSRNRFTDEFKRDAVAQVVDRGYAVSEVAESGWGYARSRFIHGGRSCLSPLKKQRSIQGKTARYGG